MKELVEENELYRKGRCINLVAAESVLSPLAEKLLRSDLSRRGAFGGEIGDRHTRGAKYFDGIEALTLELGKRLFECRFVEPGPLSGSYANGLAIRCLTEPGQTSLVPGSPIGHQTARGEGYMGYRGVRVVDLPFNYYDFNIDTEGLSTVASEAKPSLIVVGSAWMLFPIPLAQISKIAREVGAKILYDGAHVLGLMAGKRFQDPLKEGAYVVTGSTQKTLSGPHGGIIIYDDLELHKKLDPVIHGHLSTPGYERFAALAVTFAEMLSFGVKYAEQIVRNAKSLARALDMEGLKVLAKHKGYTESHIVIVDAQEFGGGQECAVRLEDANIITTIFHSDTKEWRFDGIRLGVQEETRRGMREAEMKEVGEIIRKVIIDREDAAATKRRVTELREKFNKVQYCFTDETKL